MRGEIDEDDVEVVFEKGDEGEELGVRAEDAVEKEEWWFGVCANGCMPHLFWWSGILCGHVGG